MRCSKKWRNLSVFYRKENSKKAISKMLSSGNSRKATQEPPSWWRMCYLDHPLLVCTAGGKFYCVAVPVAKSWFFPPHKSVSLGVGTDSQLNCDFIKHSTMEYKERSQAAFPHTASCCIQSLLAFWLRKPDMEQPMSDPQIQYPDPQTETHS